MQYFQCYFGVTAKTAKILVDWQLYQYIKTLNVCLIISVQIRLNHFFVHFVQNCQLSLQIPGTSIP